MFSSPKYQSLDDSDNSDDSNDSKDSNDDNLQPDMIGPDPDNSNGDQETNQKSHRFSSSIKSPLHFIQNLRRSPQSFESLNEGDNLNDNINQQKTIPPLLKIESENHKDPKDPKTQVKSPIQVLKALISPRSIHESIPENDGSPNQRRRSLDTPSQTHSFRNSKLFSLISPRNTNEPKNRSKNVKKYHTSANSPVFVFEPDGSVIVQGGHINKALLPPGNDGAPNKLVIE